jgi:hypothetical protein
MVSATVMQQLQLQNIEGGSHTKKFLINELSWQITYVCMKLMFADEEQFTLDGVNNIRNIHSWSADNPHNMNVSNF